jgi:hypothetical protein
VPLSTVKMQFSSSTPAPRPAGEIAAGRTRQAEIGGIGVENGIFSDRGMGRTLEREKGEAMRIARASDKDPVRVSRP